MNSVLEMVEIEYVYVEWKKLPGIKRFVSKFCLCKNMKKTNRLEALIGIVFTLEMNLDTYIVLWKKTSLPIHTSFFPGCANLNPSEDER